MVSAFRIVAACLAVAIAFGIRAGLRAKPPAVLNAENLFLSHGNFAPVCREVLVQGSCPSDGAGSDSGSPTDREVSLIAGRMPSDLRGAFLRVGPNQRRRPEGYLHWFDGDGMVHAVTALNSDADTGVVNLTYANHWVRTTRLLEDDRTGRAISPGLGAFLGLRGLASLVKFGFNAATGARDVETTPPGLRTDAIVPSNTAMVYHDHRLLVLVEAGSPFRMRLHGDGRLESVGLHRYGGSLTHPFTAHPKVDPETGDMFFFGYNLLGELAGAPYMSYGVVSKAGDLVRSFGVDLKDGVPVMAHDFAITEHYAIIFDMPLTLRFGRLFDGGYGFRGEDRPFRFGILPRMATSDATIQWFDAAPGYTIHTVNAWEETAADGSTEVVLVLIWYAPGDLWLEFGFGKGPDHADARVLKGAYRQFRFDLRSGSVEEHTLSQSAHLYGEFPQVHPKLIGRKSRFSWFGTTLDDASAPANVFGCAKVDLADEGRVLGSIVYGDNKYGGEPVFVPKPAGVAEDDGYLWTFVHDETDATASELWVMDAQTMAKLPLARVRTPQRVPYGFHGLYLSPEQLAEQRVEEAVAPNLPLQVLE